jgi:hypothetical protein
VRCPYTMDPHDLEVLNSWILDLDTWFDYNLIPKDEKVPFTKLKLTRLAKLLVAEHATNQNPITTWIGLVEALSLFLSFQLQTRYEHQVASPMSRIQHACKSTSTSSTSCEFFSTSLIQLTNLSSSLKVDCRNICIMS